MVKAIIIGIVITIVGLFALSVVDKVASGDALINGQPTTEVVDESKNKVSISGEINHPGSYYVSPDQTLAFLIDLAGDVTADADSSCYNPSILIGTRTSFYIPPVAASQGVCVDSEMAKTNINTADANDLEKVGFNSSQALNLVDYRESNGLFETIEDIVKVKGIGQATFEKVQNKISIS